METPVGKYDEEEERWDGGDEEEHPEKPTIHLFILKWEKTTPPLYTLFCLWYMNYELYLKRILFDRIYCFMMKIYFDVLRCNT